MEAKKRSSTKPGRRRANAEARRERLLQATIKVFSTKGYHAARIEDIIAEAKVGKGTFYLHFKGKEEVFAALLDIFIAEINKTLNWVFQQLEPGTCPERIFTEESSRIFETLKKHQALARIVYREGRSVSPRIDQKIRNFYQEIVQISATNLQTAIDLELLPAFNAKIGAICIVGAVEKVYQLWLEGHLEATSPREILQQTLVFMLRGCGIFSAQSGS